MLNLELIEMSEILKANLMLAIRNNNVLSVKEILDSAAQNMNIDFEYEYSTPLEQACLHKNYVICEMLLNNGANPNKASLHWGCALNLISSEDNPNNIAIAELLLESGADVNFTYAFHRSALSVACQNGATKMVKLLLENSASIDDPSNPNLSAFATAVVGHNTNQAEIVRLLVEKNPYVNVDILPIHNEGKSLIMSIVDEYKALHITEVSEKEDIQEIPILVLVLEINPTCHETQVEALGE